MIKLVVILLILLTTILFIQIWFVDDDDEEVVSWNGFEHACYERFSRSGSISSLSSGFMKRNMGFRVMRGLWVRGRGLEVERGLDVV